MRQANIKQAVLLACVLVAVVIAAGDSGPPERGHAAPYSDSIDSPPVTFIGGRGGELFRCSRDSVCEIFYQTISPINAVVISGEYVYAGLASGVILRCHVNIKYSCDTFYDARSNVLSLISIRGYLLVALVNGTIQDCELYQANCRTLHILKHKAYVLMHINNSIYAGLGTGQLMHCSLSKGITCSQIYQANNPITDLQNIGKNMYILTNVGDLSKCSDPTATYCDYLKNIGFSRNIVAFNGSLYVQDDDSSICKWVNDDNCEDFIKTSAFRSFAMAYGTNNLRNQYKNEHVTCEQSAQQCQLVTYYNEPERSAFEVYVKEGRLYSTDSLVDTSDADQGHAGPAAIFIMAPDGKLYLSNHHQGATRTSSFLAGNPVSGAGEIVVERGVVRKILACSEHYEPTLELNAQVVHSLLAQGYTDHIVSELCPESTGNKTNTASDVENLDKKLQIIYSMQQSLDDLIKVYATEVKALKEKTDNRIDPKQGTCKCSDVANGQ